MADVITRFRLETNQFDSALRNAANGLTNITKQLSLAGKDFDKFAQKHVESARSLGQVESGANNLKDKLRDLVSAYNNVAKAYNNLTKEQQQGDFGKAMAASLDQLQSRITQTKNELYGMSDSTKQVGTGLGSLNDIFGMSITKLAGWGTAIAAAKGALDVAKDAFMQSETNIDDWGRTIEGAKGAYDVFLNTLNNGNWSNFFRNIETAINGAKDLYDALDRLSSIKSNNQAAIAIVQAEIQQLRVLKQQGKDVDDQIKQATQRLKSLQSQSVNAGKTAGTVSMREVIRNEANSIKGGAQVSDRSINAAIEGIVRKGQAEFDKYRRNVDVFEKNPRFQSEVAVNYTTSAGTQTTYVKQFDINKLTEEQQRQYKLSKAITEGETRIQEGISIYAQAVQEGAQSAREEFRGNRYALQGNGTRSGSGKTATGKTETELKQNEAAVAKLTEEYQKLATDAKTANDAQLSGIKERQAAIQTEIANLKTRNEELKKFAAEAQGIQVNIGINSSLPDLTAKLKELQAAQSQALNGTEWQEYQKQIEQVNLQIDAMKGKWKDGMKATFTLQAPQDLNIPAKTVEFKADNADVLNQLREVQGVTIDDKTLTVTANTADAVSALQQVDGLTIRPKTVEFKADNADVLNQLREVQGVTIDPKTLTVTANTAEAIAALQQVEGLTIQPKQVGFKADNADVLNQLREVQGVTIDPKTLTVTANTADAVAALQQVEGLTIQPKTVEFKADNADVLNQLREVQGVTIDDKTLTVTANTAEAIAALQQVEGLTIQPKTVEFKADNADVLNQLREVEGVTIDDKTLTVTANTSEAIAALQQVEGLTIQPKQIEFKADNAEVLEQIREVQGVTIDDKTLTVTANTSEAIAALQQVEGLTIQPKTVGFKADNAAVLEQLSEVEGVTIDPKMLTVTANTSEAIAALQQVEGLTIQPKTVEFKADNADVLNQLREVQDVTIDDKTLTVTANTSEAYNKVQELLGTVEGASVRFAVEPDLQVGTNIQSDAGISAYINMLKQQLQTADYGSALYQGLTEQLSDTTTLQSLVQESLKAGLGTAMFDIADELGKDFWTRAMEGGVENIEWDSIAEQINDARKAAGLDKIDFNVGGNIAETGKETEASWKSAAAAVQNVGTALKSVEDPGAKIAGIIGQAIANIALGFAQASASSSKLGVFGWIAAVTGGLATMISTIAAIHSSTGYAEGGMIKGNSYSGDNLKAIVDGGDMVGLNAGEIVLNKAQTGNLASALQERDGNPSSSKPYVTGDTIVLGVNNWARKHGKGELVFTRG